MTRNMLKHLGRFLAAGAVLAGCGDSMSDAGDDRPADWTILQTPADRIAVVTGFSGPESVRYDPDLDAYFVGNMNGDPTERDANGFVTRMSVEGEIETLRFAVGPPGGPGLHAPRGMTITGDTLWVVDIDGVHGFHRHSGEHLHFVDFSDHDPGFLNDVAQAGSDALYVTDTGRSALFQLRGRDVSVVLADSALGSPNGITWDPDRNSLVMVPWDDGHRITLWRPDSEPTTWRTPTPGFLDGVEAIDRRILLASQTDSSVHILDASAGLRVIRTAGAPADIGIDTQRRRIAVPYVDLDQVDLWALPAR